MFTKDVVTAIIDAANETGFEPAALLAVAEVEGGGRAFASVGGRHEPLIRFEGHYFDRRLSSAARDRARAEGLASPQAGAVANPPTQAARWTLLGRATEIDRQAAYESTSWGLGQVMGAHWAWLGFGDVDALVAEARSGAAGQGRLMIRYIEKAGLAAALREHDWETFARGYNGPGYRRYAYHLKIAAAYKRHAATTAPSKAGAATRSAGTGATDEDIRVLQQSLSALGYPVRCDGKFGPETERALRQFQKQRGLAADGIAGPKTRAAIAAAMPFGSAGKPLWRWLLSWLARLFRIG